MCKFVSVVSLAVAIACIAAIAIACWQPWPQVTHVCDPADSKALCAQVQKCFESTSAATCREAERTAIQLSQPNPMLMNNGAAKALTY
jgi:hypothetical protein